VGWKGQDLEEEEEQDEEEVPFVTFTFMTRPQL